MALDQITNEEILKDIADTEAEIVQMTQEAEHLEITPHGLPSVRWNHMRASVRRNGIAERQKFIAKLRKILEERGAR